MQVCTYMPATVLTQFHYWLAGYYWEECKSQYMYTLIQCTSLVSLSVGHMNVIVSFPD